ncbi:MAG: hypothetical protein ACYCPQ_05140 [Elusimicrobiota bacterium]
MSEESKDGAKEGCGKGCGRKCGGCKFLAGLIVGLLLAGTAFGFYMAGRAHMCGHKAMCPFGTMMAQPGRPLK